MHIRDCTHIMWPSDITKTLLCGKTLYMHSQIWRYSSVSMVSEGHLIWVRSLIAVRKNTTAHNLSLHTIFLISGIWLLPCMIIQFKICFIDFYVFIRIGGGLCLDLCICCTFLHIKLSTFQWVCLSPKFYQSVIVVPCAFCKASEAFH